MARKELDPFDIVALIDTREQRPLTLALPSWRQALPTGDYSVRGLENEIAIERKSLEDFLGCCGGERKRFEAEIQRLRAYECKAIIIESTWAALERGGWQSKITPEAAMGSALGFLASGVPIIMAESREKAAILVSRLLFIAARRRWRMAQEFLTSLKIG